MSPVIDFERTWLLKLSNAIDFSSGEDIRRKVLDGSENLTDKTPRQEIIEWTVNAVEKLESHLGEAETDRIMTLCACRYPTSGLQKAREVWERTGYIDRVVDILQEQFESSMRDSIDLSEEEIEYVVSRNMGLAGIRQENTIIATKIPKSGFLKKYINEKDSKKRREYYCHCPRVRDAIKSGDAVPPSYCYCGAGFYKGIWEDILQMPVEVEVIESLFTGSDVCRIAIHLPVGNASINL